VRLLLEQGIVDPEALDFAVYREHEAAVRLLLLQNGIGSRSRRKALGLATMGGYEAVVRLLRRGQDLLSGE
jgi:hypothetical protein